MRAYIHESYHFHWPHAVGGSSRGPHGQLVLERRARQLLSLLRRANEGYLRPLERVLLLSYGRLGRRRYALLEPYFGVVAAGRPAYRRDPGPLRTAPPGWRPVRALQLLVRAQAQSQAVRDAKVVPAIREAVLPDARFYKSGKRVPQEKVVQKWYASLRERVLPPLPPDEWRVLHGLVDGSEPWAVPERRRVVRERGGGLQEETSAAHGILRALTPEMLVFGPEKGQTFESYTRGRPHRITRRLMTTLWGRVLDIVPRLEYESVQESSAGQAQPAQLVVRWGRLHAAPPIYRTVRPGMAAEALFAGVDEDGRVPSGTH
ncbi:hypothetical protein KEM52_005054 [Ascosphaera acerosa]|nr:hypothetical protein KEM52_005054 [Ascosphaera acerosa]